MLQTGARILWNVKISNILSLASDTPVDVRVEHNKSRWELKSYHRSPLDKVVNVRVHSYGFSSTNHPKNPHKLDYEGLWDTLPVIETNGAWIRDYRVTATDRPAKDSMN